MRSPFQRPATDRGFSLVEVLIGSVLALIGVGVYVGLQVYQARQDKDVDSRLAALCEARAAMEAQLARPLASLSVTAAPALIGPIPVPLPSPVGGAGPAIPPPRSPFRELPGAELSCGIRPYAEAPAGPGVALEIEVEARWLEDGALRSLKLVTVRTDAWPLEGP